MKKLMICALTATVYSSCFSVDVRSLEYIAMLQQQPEVKQGKELLAILENWEKDASKITAEEMTKFVEAFNTFMEDLEETDGVSIHRILQNLYFSITSKLWNINETSKEIFKKAILEISDTEKQKIIIKHLEHMGITIFPTDEKVN